MRVVASKTLRNFWKVYPKVKLALEIWESRIQSQIWANPNEIITNFPGSDTVGNNRIVFNIVRNDFRLIVTFRYKIQVCYINFINTHEEYDKIDDVKTVNLPKQ